MNKLYLVLIGFLLISCGNSKRTFLNENGEKISSGEFLKKWRQKENNLFRWDLINEKGQREAKLFSPVYKVYQINYPALISKLEEISNRKFTASQVIIISYSYVNDLCGQEFSNNWNREKILTWKRFTTPRKNKIEETQNRIFLKFFEEGIALENSEETVDEYFFLDKGNFLRNNFFQQPALCGSYAIIKPNGQVLVRNGEYDVLSMADHLIPGNWDLFFPDSKI